MCWAVHQTHLGREDPPADTWRPARIGQHWDWWHQDAPTTSQFAVHYLIACLHPAAGGFTTKVPPSPELAGRLRGTERTSIDLGGQVLIEDDDLVVLAGKSPWAPPAKRPSSLSRPQSGQAGPAPSRNSLLILPGVVDGDMASSPACPTDDLSMAGLATPGNSVASGQSKIVTCRHQPSSSGSSPRPRHPFRGSR